MTYDEAVTAVASLLPCDIEDCAACGRQAKGIPDAIGYRQMQERITSRETQLHQALELVSEARALADRLVEAIFPDSNDESADIAEREEALAAYENRSWK